MQSGLNILKAPWIERGGCRERGGYLCTRRRQLECFLHDISFLHDSLNEKFPSRVRCASSFKVPWKSFLLWPRCPSKLPVPKTNCCHCTLMRRKGGGCSYCTFSLLNISDSLSTPCLKKNPSLQKAWEAESGGFRRESRSRRDNKRRNRQRWRVNVEEKQSKKRPI